MLGEPDGERVLVDETVAATEVLGVPVEVSDGVTVTDGDLLPCSCLR